MSSESVVQETLMEKINALPPEKVVEVEDFVDFLRVRAQDRGLTRAASHMSQDVFRKVWDNPNDAAYDHL
jgi:hypothetical protein